MIKRLNPKGTYNRVNKACKYFPCHKGLEDCTFCYCPFYPCLDRTKGSYVYPSRFKKGVWSCADCSWIHKGKVTERIFALIRKNKYRVWKEMFLPKVKRQDLNNSKTGIIILSHGSKLKKANTSLAKTVEAIKQKTRLNMILPAYLQFYQPNLTESIKNLIIQGCQTVIIIPFFLFNGNHVTRDIPNIMEKEKAKYPKVKFVYTKSLGLDIRIADIIVDMVEEAIT